MKDYSMNLEERKDFILGYDITEEGQIIVKFAKGEPWPIPYNEENEQKILDVMEMQVYKAKNNVAQLKLKSKVLCSGSLGTILSSAGCIALGAIFAIPEFLISAAIIGTAGMALAITAIKPTIKYVDLEKNINFLEMKDKLNGNARNINQNVLTNVSNKTKRVIEGAPKGKEVFNINSFNYVPFRDLEQIMENVDRNEKFGFDYTKAEKSKAKTRTR